MEENLKRIRTIAILLIAILISVIAFCGVYLFKSGVWNNYIPGFKYGMELSGMRELRFVLDDTSDEKEVYVDENGNICGEVVKEDTSSSNTEVSLEETGENAEAPKEETEEEKDPALEGYTIETRTIKTNEDSAINKENFEKAKKIIQKRLERNATYEYNIRLDDATGELILEVPDNDELESVESLVRTPGKLEIIDSQNGLRLLDDSGLKSVTKTDINTESGYQPYLVLTFDKNGAEKIKEISNKYVATKVEEQEDNSAEKAEGTEETTEASTNESNEEKKYITINLDGQAILKTYFGQELSNGVLQIPWGQATSDYDTFVKASKEADGVAQILNDEELPLTYKLSSDNYIKSSIHENVLNIFKISVAVVIAVVSIYFIIRYRLNGFKSAILALGYIGLIVIIFRYTNVVITVNSLISLISTYLTMKIIIQISRFWRMKDMNC